MMELSGGCQARLKAQGLGPCLVGVHEFKSRPPHQILFFVEEINKDLLMTVPA